MGEISYAPLIEDMTWSHSRVKGFEDCPYAWYLTYIEEYPREQTFFASYGSFMHQILEMYFNKTMDEKSLVLHYLLHYDEEVVGEPPNKKIALNYYQKGLDYVENIDANLEEFKDFKVLGTEIHFKTIVNGREFIGFIDLLLEDKNGKLYLVDHKSRDLKKRSTRKKPTKSDIELDEYLKQLYLYSVYIEQTYGRLPDYLCFNCFKESLIIVEAFNSETYTQVLNEYCEQINSIIAEEDFLPNEDYWRCHHLCDQKYNCEYFEE